MSVLEQICVQLWVSSTHPLTSKGAFIIYERGGLDDFRGGAPVLYMEFRGGAPVLYMKSRGGAPVLYMEIPKFPRYLARNRRVAMRRIYLLYIISHILSNGKILEYEK